MKRQKTIGWIVGVVAVLASIVVFLVPFAFIFLTAAKSGPEAANFDFTLPTQWQLWQNIQEVLTVRQYVVLRAFINSTTLTVFSVASWSSCRRWWATCCSGAAPAGTRS